MFLDGEAICHSGNVIGDDACCRQRPRPIASLPPFLGQALRLVDEELEELAHGPARLLAIRLTL